MNIGIVSSHASTGGWRYVFLLARGLKETDPQAAITVYHGTERVSSVKADDFARHGVRFESLSALPAPEPPPELKGSAFSTGSASLYRRMRSLMRQWRDGRRGQIAARSLGRHDVVHFAWPFGIAPPVLDVPMTFIPHDFIYTHEFGLGGDGQAQWLFMRHNHRRWLDRATPVVSSDFIAAELRRSFPEYSGPVHVVRLPYLNPPPASRYADTAHFCKFAGERSLPNRFILCPNNVTLHKNLPTLLSAMWHVKQNCPGVKLILTGWGTNTIRAIVNSPLYADRTTCPKDCDVLGLGLVSDDELMGLMQRAELVVNASLCEAGSGSGADAWACGCPVALSGIPAYREQVEHYGTAAEFFDPRDPKDMARAMIRLLQNRELAAQNVRSSLAALSHVSWRDTADQYRDVFRQACTANAKADSVDSTVPPRPMKERGS